MSEIKPLKEVTVPYRLQKGYQTRSIKAKTTKVAGLVVCPKHVLRVITKGSDVKEELLVVQGEWEILQYPLGFSVLKGFKSEEDAFNVAENNLKDYDWVCIYVSDMEKRNDIQDVRSRLNEIRREMDLDP